MSKAPATKSSLFKHGVSGDGSIASDAIDNFGLMTADAIGEGTSTGAANHQVTGDIGGNGGFSAIVPTLTDGIVNSSLLQGNLAGGSVAATAVSLDTNGGSSLGLALTMEGPAPFSVGTAATVTVADGATVEIDGASAQSVTFTGTTGTLKLDNPLAFTGEISGLAGSDAIDLASIKYGSNTTAAFSGGANSGTLTVTDGTNTAHIDLLGDYLHSGWTLSSDGNGGTLVVDPPLFPDATTTGVPAGKTLTTYNGTLIVTTPGAVIDGLNITGGVVIEAPNVTIQNCVITGSSWFVVLFDSSSGATNGTVLNCQIYGGGSGAAPGQHGVVGGHLIQGNNIHDVEQGIAPESGSTIQGNYIHDLNNPQADPHYDGILILGGSSDITIQNNTINNPHNQTDAIMIQNYNGPISNIIVNNNQLIGGGYTVYSDASHGTDAITGVQVTNNYIGGGAFGYVYFTGNSPLYAGNVDEFTGQLLPGQDAAALAITAFSTDSNIVGDGITNDNTLTLSGNAPANSTIKVFDGTTQIGTTTANASGTWSYNTATLADGSHGFSISATSNGTTATSTALTVKVDTKAPSAPTITSFAPDTGTVGDGVTTSNTLTLTGSAEANSTVKVSDGTTQIGTATANASGVWNLTTGTLSNATHAFTAVALDAAGNTSGVSTALNVTVNAPPNLVVNGNFETGDFTGWTLGGNYGMSWAGAQTSVDSQAESGQYAAAIGAMGSDATLSQTLQTVAGKQYTLSFWLANNGAGTNDFTVKWNGATVMALANAPAQGYTQYTFTVTATGATSTLEFDGRQDPSSWRLDNISVTGIGTQASSVPTITSFTPDTGVVGDGITDPAVLTLTGTAVANSTVNVYDGTKLLGTATANASGAWSFTTAALPDGAHSFTATDTVSGVTSAPSAVMNVTIDTVAPVAPTIASFTTDSGTVGDHITNDASLTLTGTAEANSTVKVFDGTTLLGSATANASGAWTYTTATLANGTHNLTATASDAAANTSAASAPLSVTVDTTAPVAPVIVGDAISGTDQVILNGTAEANSIVKVFEGTTLLGTTTADSSGSWTVTTPSLAAGKHDFTATATDAAGNTSVLSAPLDPVIGTASTGFPDATNTGVPAGVALTVYNGDLVITTPGAVIQGLDIHGSVTIAADNVTLLNCKITTSEQFDVNCRGVTGTIVQNCEINGLGATSNSMGIIGSQGSFIGNNIYNVENGICVEGSGTLIQDNFIHDLSASGSPHYDGIQMSGGFSNITILHNTIIGINNGAVYLTNDFGGISNVVIDDNQLEGGAFPCFVDYKSAKAGTLTNIQFTNNVIAPGIFVTDHGGYLTFLQDGTRSQTLINTLGWTGNTDLATGEALANDGTLTPLTNVPLITAFTTDSNIVGDGVTSDATLVLTGTAPANSTVNVYDGTTKLGTAAADASGAWNFTTAALTDGTHSFTATDTVSGTTSAASPAVNVTIDTKAPSAPTITSYTTDSGTVGDGVTNDATLTLTGTAEANATVKVYDGTTLLGTATANGSGAWSYTTAALASGPHSLTAKATDAAGNTGVASAALSVTIDTTAPTGGTPDLIAASDSGASTTDNITDITSPTFTVALNPTVAVGDTVQLLLGGSALAHNVTHTITSADIAAGSVSLVVTAGDLGLDGSKSISAKFTDTAGNTSTTSALAVMLDTTAPTVASVVASGAGISSGAGALNAGDVVTLTLNLSAAVTVTGGTPTLTLNDGGTATYTGGSGTNTLTFSYTVAAGQNTSDLTVTAVNFNSATVADAAGNVANLAGAVTNPAGTLRIDTTAPVAPSIASFSTDSGTVGDHITNDTTLILTGTAEANSTVKVYDGATLLGSATVNGSGAWTYTTAALANGAHSLTATATDAAGNTGVASSVQSVTVDTVAPKAPVITSDAIVNTNEVLLTGTAEVGSTVKIFEGATLLGAAAVNGSGAWSYTTSPLADGPHAFTATATDAAGNTSLASQYIDPVVGTGTVIDSSGVTSLTDIAKHYYLLDSTSTGPSLKYGGADYVEGQFGTWTPIGAEKTATGYEVAWHDTSSGQYTVWNTDSNGNWISNIAPVSGTGAALESLETSFNQDLNGDGQIGLAKTVIEANGATSLTQVADHFFLYDSTSAGPSLKFGGADYVEGQFGAWTPIGAEKTATGYEVAWHDTSSGQYTVWNTGSNGNWISNIAPVSGTGAALESLETSFNQDLNGDGQIGLAKTVIEANGATSLTQVADHFFLYDSTSAGPSLKFGGADFMAGQLGTWTPIGAEKTATGYEVAWKTAGADQYTVWNTDNNGSYVSNIPVVSGTGAALESLEPGFHQDLNGDGYIGLVLNGTSGGQTLNAGSSPTTLIGGPNDILNGGAGADTFVFPTNFGHNTVNNFTPNADALQFSQSMFATVAAVLSDAQQVGSNVVITHDAQNAVTLQNMLLSNLHASDIHIV